MLGFTLMDSFGPKPGPFGGKALGKLLKDTYISNICLLYITST